MRKPGWSLVQTLSLSAGWSSPECSYMLVVVLDRLTTAVQITYWKAQSASTVWEGLSVRDQKELMEKLWFRIKLGIYRDAPTDRTVIHHSAFPPPAPSVCHSLPKLPSCQWTIVWGHSHLQHGFTVMWTAERTLKVTIISWQFLLLAEFMVTRLLNPALCMADFPADGSEPAHVEIRDCTSDMGSLWIKSARRGPSDTACCERAQPVCLAATHTEGCQPWDTVELFKDVSPGREEGAVWASSVTSISTTNPSAAAIWIQLEQVSCTPYSWATAPKAGLIRTFQTPGLCEILTSSLMAQQQSLYFFLFCNNRKSEWYFLGLLIQFYLYLVSYRCPCDEHHHSHCFCLEMESLQDLPPQNGILHPWNLYITETGNWQR